MARVIKEVWLWIRDGTGLDLGVIVRRTRISSWRRPSFIVRSSDALEGRGVSKDSEEGTWQGNWREDGAILSEVLAAEMCARRVVRFWTLDKGA